MQVNRVSRRTHLGINYDNGKKHIGSIGLQKFRTQKHTIIVVGTMRNSPIELDSNEVHF